MFGAPRTNPAGSGGLPRALSSGDGVLAPCPSPSTAGVVAQAGQGVCASPRLCLPPSHGPKVPRQDFVPLHLGCAPRVPRLPLPAEGTRAGGRRQRQSDTEGAVTSQGQLAAGAQPQERGEGMLQTLGLSPLPPPRCCSYQLAGGQGCYGNVRCSRSTPQSSELSGSWRGHKDTEQWPGMSFVPVALLCSPGVLGEFVTHCGFLRAQSCRQSDSGLDSVPSCAAPASSSAAQGHTHRKRLFQELLQEGLPAAGAPQDPRSGAQSTPGSRGAAAPVPGGIWRSPLPLPSLE